LLPTQADVAIEAKLQCVVIALLKLALREDRLEEGLLNLWLNGIYPGAISFNLAELAPRHPSLPQNFLQKVTSARVPLYRIMVEVTETVFSDESLNVSDGCWAQLRAAGCKVALDDWGPVSRFYRLRGTFLSIGSKSIGRSSLACHPSRKTGEAIARLAQKLDIRLLLKGVETEDHSAFW
jgi:EAL domain-containing protein (putative c-di-GMP-specific phosphodiesterase class I)